MKANLDSAVLTAHLATKFLKPNGMVILTGADGALMKATPGMCLIYSLFFYYLFFPL